MVENGILGSIVASKQKEVLERQKIYPKALLEQSMYFPTPCCSLKSYLERQDLSGVIAEVKRKSPSKGTFHTSLNVANVSLGYMQAGASALSILTDKEYFGGSLEDLRTARKNNYCPILRKDFLIDEYQLWEAKSAGADVILLIRACLDNAAIDRLASQAKELGMEVLLEVHSEEELSGIDWQKIDVLGVNNRNLKDFSVDISLSAKLFPKLPKEKICIVESGIHSVSDMLSFWKLGYRGFLMGEAFLKEAHPAQACQKLIDAWIAARREDLGQNL